MTRKSHGRSSRPSPGGTKYYSEGCESLENGYDHFRGIHIPRYNISSLRDLDGMS